MKKTQIDLLQGTLDLLVLKTLQTDRRRAETIDGGDRDLETIHRSGRTDSENVMNGRVWPCSTV
jgi:hypothetical protein